MATSASPEEVEDLFPRSHAVGRHFGVMLVVVGDTPVEVATFREEEAYHDGRRPRRVSYSGLEEDAARRDFTVNALYYDPLREEVVDPLGVRADLEGKVLRTVGEPDERFREDHLRLLRAVRLATTLEFRLEPATLASVARNAALVMRVAAERIREELRRGLAHHRRASFVRLLDETGLLEPLLPEVAALRGVAQPPDHHPEGDVFRHTLLTLDHLPPESSFSLALGALLHDIGKPATSTEDGGRIRFHGHEVRGAEMAEVIGRRLRLSRRERQRVVWLVRHHLVFLQAARMRRSTLRRRLDEEGFEELHALHRADCLASHGDLSAWRVVDELKRELEGEPAVPAPLLTGKDLLDLGMEPGPAIGRVLRRIQTAQLDGEVVNRDQALSLARRIVEDE